MTVPIPHMPLHVACTHEEALNRYVDGELAFETQPALFSHLASCSTCRRTLEAVLVFRRLSRQEPLVVPPAADDSFFKRLDQIKRRGERVDRQAARRPMWQWRTPVSLGLAAVVAVLVFVAGMFASGSNAAVAESPLVVGAEERVLFNEPTRPEAVYVFYPGLTVEATKLVEPIPQAAEP